MIENVFERLIESNIRIVQTANCRTGSTLLVNILLGLLCPDKPVKFIPWEIPLKEQEDFFVDNFIIKTHGDPFKEYVGHFPQYNLYFVESTRKELSYHIPSEINALKIDYEEFIEKDNQPLEIAVSNVANKLKAFIPNEIAVLVNELSCIERIKNMNSFYDTNLKNLNWGAETDSLYGLHGSHRSRLPQK